MTGFSRFLPSWRKVQGRRLILHDSQSSSLTMTHLTFLRRQSSQLRVLAFLCALSSSSDDSCWCVRWALWTVVSGLRDGPAAAVAEYPPTPPLTPAGSGRGFMVALMPTSSCWSGAKMLVRRQV